jgi:hypothetical protein
MMRGLPALGLLLLAACAGGAPAPPAAPPEDPVAAACRAEARGAPALRGLAQQANFDNPNNADRIGNERRQIEARLYGECMRRRGLTRGGGVEPVRRSGF